MKWQIKCLAQNKLASQLQLRVREKKINLISQSKHVVIMYIQVGWKTVNPDQLAS